MDSLTLVVSSGARAISVDLGNKVALPLFVCASSSLASARLKLGPLMRLGDASGVAAPAAGMPSDAAAPVVVTPEIDRLPPYRKLSAVVLATIVRHIVQHLHDIIVSSIPTGAPVVASAVRGVAPSTLRDGSAAVCSWSFSIADPAGVALVAAAVRPLINTPTHELLVAAYASRCGFLFKLHRQVFEAMVARSGASELSALSLMAGLRSLMMAVAAAALLVPAPGIAVLESALNSSVESAVQEMFRSRIPYLHKQLRAYLATPSVLATFTRPLAELRTTLRFTLSTLSTTGSDATAIDLIRGLCLLQ